MTSLTGKTSKDGFNDDLPLVQVDVKLVLGTPLGLGPLNVSRLFSELLPKYPIIDNSGFSDQIPGLPIVEIPSGELDGMVLSNERTTCFVHRNMLSIRWASSSLGEKRDYPGFDRLIEELEALAGMVSKILNVQLQPYIANMSYKNFITNPDAGLWFLKNAPSFKSEELKPFSWEYFARKAPATDLRVRVEFGTATQEQIPGFIFSTACGQRILTEDWVTSFRTVHDDLTENFPSLLSEEAIKLWV